MNKNKQVLTLKKHEDIGFTLKGINIFFTELTVELNKHYTLKSQAVKQCSKISDMISELRSTLDDMVYSENWTRGETNNYNYVYYGRERKIKL